MNSPSTERASTSGEPDRLKFLPSADDPASAFGRWEHRQAPEPRGTAARRPYLIPIVAGAGIFLVVHLIDAVLASTGMHAESTYIDDLILGIIVAVLAFVIQRQHELELRRQRRCAAVIDQMNHHIRNALQVIVGRANLGLNSHAELGQITTAVERIDWALREILPHSLGTVRGADPQSRAAQRKDPARVGGGSSSERKTRD